MRTWIAVAVTLVLLGLGASWYFVVQRPSAAAAATPNGGPASAPADKGHFSLLILGADERPDDPGRSDTIMLANVDLDNKQVHLVSVPRDIYVKIEGHGYDKLNHAYAFGKEQLSKSTLENYLGLPIDHYVVVNMDGFKRIVQAVGGVTLDVEKDMDYDDPYDDPPLHIHLKKGVQRLTPDQAIGYVRFRHDAESDYGRARRQQQFLKALAQEVLKPANLLKLPQIASAAYQSVRTDLPLSQALRLALIAKNMGSGSVVADGTVPIQDDYWHDGVAYLRANLVDVRTKIYKLIKGEDPPPEFLAKARADNGVYQTVFVPDPPPPPTPTPTRPAPTPTPTTPTPSKTQWTVVVVDASQRNVAPRYVAALNDAGLSVVRVARSLPLGNSVVILRTNDPTVRAKLEKLFPNVRFQFQAANRDAESPIEVVLGTDATA